VGTDPDAIVAGDFTGDGRLDLAVADASDLLSETPEPGGVSVLLGNGDGTFGPQVTYDVGIDPDAIVAGDFTGNGRLDLAVANGGAVYSGYSGWAPCSVSVLLNNGGGTFGPQVTYAVGSDPDAIVAGDFTGNGQLDLAVANARDNTVSLLVGNGDGSFQTGVTYSVGTAPDGMVAGDFTGDGQTGLAVANGGNEGSHDGSVSVLLGNGGGTFPSRGESATGPLATPVVADVTGDGTDDVLVVDGSGNILFRQGIPGQPGTFQPPIKINPGFPSRDIAWVPKTVEGPLLASVDTQDNAVSLYAWRNGGFVRIGSLTTGQLPAQIIAANLDGTGYDDLVVRNAGDGSLSVFWGDTFTGPGRPGPDVPIFQPSSPIPVGLGVSDVAAVDTAADGRDTAGDGRLDLVVTNKLTGQVSVLLNQWNGTFAAPIPYCGGTGISAIEPGSPPEVANLGATAGVAAGPLTGGGRTRLVTINPGSNTIDVLAGLGGGGFANPVTIDTASPAQVVRMADFTGNGIDDLALLTANGLFIYLSDGHGGFLPPTTYATPPESDGLTVADLTGSGKLDLLVGDAYGDVLVLMGNGDGTFQPYREANQDIVMAVADLTGNGTEDVVCADQGLDQVVVYYGVSQSTVLADRASGLLDPGAVALADLNGDRIPDLIVANSGGNNVMIYPGLGNGQFGPAVNDGNGYFVGTNPVGITVAYLTGKLPDLVVADEGSNQVSILLNHSDGNNFSFTLGPRLDTWGDGPVSTVVGNFTSSAYPDLLVTNSVSNDVTLLPGVGQGFFNDSAYRVYSVGSEPVASFVGNFDGNTDLVTVNAGSNDLTLISGFEGANPVTTPIASGGVDPTTAFDFSSGNGFEDLVVGNTGDGTLALFEGGPDGLSMHSVETEPDLPDPTSLAFSALTGGQVQFYAAAAGQKSAQLVALSLGIDLQAVSEQSAASPAQAGVQLVAFDGSSLPLIASVLTTAIIGPIEPSLVLSESEPTATAAFLPGTGTALGQGLSSEGRSGPASGEESPASNQAATAGVGAVAGALQPWERLLLGQDQAFEQFERANPDGISGSAAGLGAAPSEAAGQGPSGAGPESPQAGGTAAPGGPTSSISAPDLAPGLDQSIPVERASPATAEAIDAAISRFWSHDNDDGPVAARSSLGIKKGSTRTWERAPFPLGLDGAGPSRAGVRLSASGWIDRPTSGLDGALASAPLREPGRDEPGPLLAGVLVSMLAAGCTGPPRLNPTGRFIRSGPWTKWPCTIPGVRARRSEKLGLVPGNRWA
jgi:hypothetical protein